jgi:hypothetical protein
MFCHETWEAPPATDVPQGTELNQRQFQLPVQPMYRAAVSLPSTQSPIPLSHLSHRGIIHNCEEVEIAVRERLRMQQPDLSRDGLLELATG